MKFRLLLIGILCSFSLIMRAQYTFELRVDNVARIGNQDLFSLSGVIEAGRVESGKTYYTDKGVKFEVKNIISSKSATSVPVATDQESVSLSIATEHFDVIRHEVLRCISSRPGVLGQQVRSSGPQMQEGQLQCKINGRQYRSKLISKPVYMKEVDVLDMFFESEDKSVLWIQINDFSKIRDMPHVLTSDTSIDDRSLVCKLAYMPKGFRPTDMPNGYYGYEDVLGNASVTLTNINRYTRTASFDFLGILRPNERVLEEKPGAGLFQLQEGRVDKISWDEY